MLRAYCGSMRNVLIFIDSFILFPASLYLLFCIFIYKFKHVESFGMAHNRHTTETNLCKNNIWFLISEAERWKRNKRRIVTD